MQQAQKKVLIITYYWPPSGGIGVLRCLKIAKYLRDYGWEPIIFTAKDAHYPSIDPSNEKDIPEGITILKQKIWEPYHIYKFITRKKKEANVNDVLYTKNDKAGIMHRFSVWVRSNFFIPDARALWIKPSVKMLSAYLAKNPVDALFTCGPPHSNTRIATLLKEKLNIPYLADFQDPWTQVDYFNQLILTKWGLAKHQRMEQEAFKAADAMTIVSKAWKKDLESIGAKNVNVVYWGYDPDDFKNIVPTIDKKFTLSHLGIMGHDRNPTNLFKAIKVLAEEVPGFADDFELRLVGQVDFMVRQSIEEFEVSKYTKFIPSVDRASALQMTCNSNVLLLLLNQQNNVAGRVPGKLFEYLAAKRPMLVIGATKGDVPSIINKTNTGQCFEYEEYQILKDKLSELYRVYRKNEISDLPNSNTDIAKYSHPVTTKQVADILDKITSQ